MPGGVAAAGFGGTHMQEISGGHALHARCCLLWISETLWPTESKELSRLCASPCNTFMERCARVDNAVKCNLQALRKLAQGLIR